MELLREVDDELRDLIAYGLKKYCAFLYVIARECFELLGRVGSGSGIVSLVDANEPQVVRSGVRDQIFEDN